MNEKLQFKEGSGFKNIFDWDKITDDFIEIFELLKNHLTLTPLKMW